jgi:hypothetical protein
MTTINRFENLIGTVHEMAANYYDETIPVMDMEFDSLERMWITGKQIGVLPSAQRLLSNRLRVPYSYLSPRPSDLQAENLNYWIQKEAKTRETFFCRFNGDGLEAEKVMTTHISRAKDVLIELFSRLPAP